MNYIKKREVFKEDLLLEKLNISGDLVNILSKIDNPVARFLINISSNNIEEDPYRQDNLSSSDKRSYFTFDDGKNQIKAGRLVNKLIKKVKGELGEAEFKKKFGTIEEKDVQKFVDQYNEILASKLKSDELTILKGDDIYKAYMHSCENRNSPLGHSCMIGKDKSLFEIYTKNPHKVKLATLWKDNIIWGDRKLLGRALLWNTENSGIVMDRIYFENSDVEMKFKSWASDKGYAYRKVQDFRESNATLFVHNSEDVIYNDLEVCLKDIDYENYPYMDTFKFIDDNSCLTNVKTPDSVKELTDDDGDYVSLVPHREIGKYFSRENLIKLDDVIENGVYQQVMEDIPEDSLILYAEEGWSSFIELFSEHESYSIIKDVLGGDAFHIFDNDYYPNIDTHWEDIEEKTKKEIVSICKKLDDDLIIFKAQSKEDFFSYKEKYPKVNFGDYDTTRDIHFKEQTYFVIRDNSVKDLTEEISENDNLEDIKREIKTAYDEAQRISNESECLNDITDSIVNYFGDGKYKVDHKLYISLDDEKIKSKIISHLGEYDINDFIATYYKGEGELIEILEHCINYYNLPNPDFNAPYYGYNADPSKLIDEMVSNRISFVEL